MFQPIDWTSKVTGNVSDIGISVWSEVSFSSFFGIVGLLIKHVMIYVLHTIPWRFMIEMALKASFIIGDSLKTWTRLHPC